MYGLVEKNTPKNAFARHTLRWEDNIKMDFCTFYTVHRGIIIDEKPTKCTNDINVLNLLHLHVSVTFDHHQGALLESTVIQRYVHSSKIYLFTNMASKTQPSCCMLTTKIKN
jgi:hypothetical protein